MSTAFTALTVTPSDSVDLQEGCQALYVGTGGTVTVTPAVGAGQVVFTNVVGGSILPVRVRRVWSTGTTASDIVALA